MERTSRASPSSASLGLLRLIELGAEIAKRRVLREQKMGAEIAKMSATYSCNPK
jgi:hypothetical protein